MQTSHLYSLDSGSKIYHQKSNSQIGILSTNISKIGDSSFISKNKSITTSQASPVRMKLFRESPKRKGLDGLVVGDYQAKKATQVAYSSVYRSSSPIRTTRMSPYHESPTRSKQRLERFKQWDSKLDIQLQIQNNSIGKMNGASLHQLLNQQSTNLGDRLNKLVPSVAQSEIITLNAKLNAIPRTDIPSFTRGHQQELTTLQQTISRIMKSSKAY